MILKIARETNWELEYKEKLQLSKCLFLGILKEYFKRSANIHVMYNIAQSNSRTLPFHVVS